MTDERWKLLDERYKITSQEEWDKHSDPGKEMLLNDNASFIYRREEDYKKKAKAFREALLWPIKGRERYDYNFAHAAEHENEDWNWKHNEEVMEQAKADFANNKKLRKKFGCWENLFFDRTLPEMISMIEGVVNGLAIDILPYLKRWPWGTEEIVFKDWMNWYDKILFASIWPFRYWEQNIYTLDQNAEYYTNFYQRVGNFFSDEPEDERDCFAIKYSFLEPERRPVIIKSLWYRSYYYHAFILRYDLHDALTKFIGFGLDPEKEKEDRMGNLAIAGFAATGFGSSSAAERYNELKSGKAIQPLRTTARSYVYMEELFLCTYGLQHWDKDRLPLSEKKKWEKYYEYSSGNTMGYAWTEYPRYFFGMKTNPIDEIIKYMK